MKIKDIRIENFGNTKLYSEKFKSDIIILEKEKSMTIIKAIGVLLKNEYITDKITEGDISDNTKIKATMRVDNTDYKVTVGVKDGEFAYSVTSDEEITEDDFYSLIAMCPEENSLAYFDLNKQNPFSERLKRYNEPQNYYSENTFSKITSGIGQTNAFRLCLNKYAGEYRKNSKQTKSIMPVVLNDDFKFSVKSITESGKENHKRTFFEFLCFINVNKFWERIEQIRNINYEKTPLIISDKYNMLADYDYSENLRGRQIFIGKSE